MAHNSRKPINKTEEQRLQDVFKQNQEIISPKGVAAAEAVARKALEEKYPGMFIPKTRTTAGIHRSR